MARMQQKSWAEMNLYEVTSVRTVMADSFGDALEKSSMVVPKMIEVRTLCAEFGEARHYKMVWSIEDQEWCYEEKDSLA